MRPDAALPRRRAVRGAATGLALAASVLGLPAAAQGAADTAFERAASGPLEIVSDRAELARDGSMVYSGNVEFTAENLIVRGDRLSLTQNGAAGLTVHVTGAPATVRHTPTEGDDRRPIDASARQIRYDRATTVVTLEGDVVLDREGDRLTGARLRYELDSQRILADGGDAGQRVRITITPETLQRRGVPEAGAGSDAAGDLPTDAPNDAPTGAPADDEADSAAAAGSDAAANAAPSAAPPAEAPAEPAPER